MKIHFTDSLLQESRAESSETMLSSKISIPAEIICTWIWLCISTTEQNIEPKFSGVIEWD